MLNICFSSSAYVMIKMTLLDEEPEVPEAKGAVVLSHPKGEIRISDVSYSYSPDVPLIEGLNLSVHPGQRIAIVGPTGCGKTTLINLLMRFYDVDGGARSRVDGQDIRDGHLPAACAAVLRHGAPGDLARARAPSGTTSPWAAPTRPRTTFWPRPRRPPTPIRLHLPPARRATTPSSARTAAACPRARSSCCASPASMLCLPPMLILDEATSSIDTRTEVQHSARPSPALMQGPHQLHRRPPAVHHPRAPTRILVMQDGHIVE